MTSVRPARVTNTFGAIPWLLWHGLRRAPGRLVLEATGIAFPVAMLAATLLFVDAAVQSMTPVALAPVQLEMRAVAKSIDADMAAVAERLAAVPGVAFAEPFAAASVIVAPGTTNQVTARLYAIKPDYLAHHPFVNVKDGDLRKGVLLSQSVKASPGFDKASSVIISLPGDAPDMSVTLPVGGTVDLRDAAPWISVPYGEAQGDVVTVPRAIIIDYDIYVRDVLPVLKIWAERGGLPPFDPGADELARATLEAHVTVDHKSYPPDPGAAEIWTGKLQKALSLLAGAPVIIADNAAEPLMESKQDATNAKIMFLLLGIPGVLVAAILGLTGASTLVEAGRREAALLRMRGATGAQITGLSIAQAVTAGVLGTLIGMAAAVLLDSAVIGSWVFRGVPASDLWWSFLPAALAGTLTSIVRVNGIWRAGKQAEVSERRLLNHGWMPLWRRGMLDIIFIVIGVAILALNLMSGGLRPGPIEGPALALSFYVLLAPVLIWLGVTLLIVRLFLVALAKSSRPERAAAFSSWQGAAWRWLGRRPAHTGRALAIGALAVAFGTEVLAFSATYQTAKQADVDAALGSDLRLTPLDPKNKLPDLGPAIAAASPIQIVPARVDSDRKVILAIDPASFSNALTTVPRMLAGAGLEGLLANARGVLINSEIAKDYELKVGDKLPLTTFPDDYENSTELELPVIGIFSSFPPTFPVTEVVAASSAIPRANILPPDFYLARLASGAIRDDVVAALREKLGQTFMIATAAAPEQRGLTALNIAGLSLIEGIGASLIASVGAAMLGAFIVLERRREFAILHALGAGQFQILTGPLLEGGVVVIGSLLIGIPVGLGLGVLSVRVLGLFFKLEPPLLTLPAAALAALAVFMAGISAAALWLALTKITRLSPASVLREP